MEIRLRPELENLIKQDVQRGSYKTVDEYVEQGFRCSTNRKLGWLRIARRSRPGLTKAMLRPDAES